MISRLKLLEVNLFTFARLSLEIINLSHTFMFFILFLSFATYFFCKGTIIIYIASDLSDSLRLFNDKSCAIQIADAIKKLPNRKDLGDEEVFLTKRFTSRVNNNV